MSVIVSVSRPAREPQHYLVYIQRTLNADSRRVRRPLPSLSALRFPTQHAFNVPWLFSEIQVGDVVWFLSALHGRGMRLPPALDARLTVASKRRLEGEGRHAAGTGRDATFVLEGAQATSFYLPWLSAAAILSSLRFAGTHDRIPVAELGAEGLSSGKYLQRLQTPRQLTPASARALEAYAKDVQRLPRAFLSYRRRETTRLAVQVATALNARRIPVWWDR